MRCSNRMRRKYFIVSFRAQRGIPLLLNFLNGEIYRFARNDWRRGFFGQAGGLLLPGMVLAACAVAAAQTPDYKNVGRAPTKEEIQAWDIAVGPHGKGRPQGSGSAQDSALIS